MSSAPALPELPVIPHAGECVLTTEMPAWARADDVKLGDILIADGGFIADNPTDPADDSFKCLAEGQRCLVEQDDHGLFVRCRTGQHYLDGQLGYTDETDGQYVGFSPASEPAPLETVR